MKHESSSWDYASARGIQRGEHVNHLLCEKHRALERTLSKKQLTFYDYTGKLNHQTGHIAKMC